LSGFLLWLEFITRVISPRSFAKFIFAVYVESFNSKPRDELLNRELFLHIDELRCVANRWRMDYNHYRPHSSFLRPSKGWTIQLTDVEKPLKTSVFAAALMATLL
jgi:hypothetical protein